MPLKCCTQYVCKFVKLSGDHRTGKGQFSFQSQRRAMPKNVQTIVLLHSFHVPARLCSKPFKLDFSSTWTENFQMYKLHLEKAGEPEIRLPTFTESRRKQGSYRKKIYFCLIDYTKDFDCENHDILWKILKQMGIPDHLTCLLRNLCAETCVQQLELDLE